MKILSGKRQKEIASDEFAERLRGCFPVHIDVGAGSGRQVLKLSEKNPGGFYIGMDPSAGSMRENSVKAAKNGKKSRPDNLLFAVGSIESVPDELAGIADIISVVLPWGSLRDGIARADALVLGNLRRLGKTGAALEILIGYDEKSEPHEMEKRGLPMLSQGHFKSLAPMYRNAGIELRGIEAIGNDALKSIESDWAKRLAYGKARTVYRIDCAYI
jgi:16S rRNA (adenine(1408)-N(1))-methyltransferase